MQRLMLPAAVAAACLWTGTAGAEVCFKLNPFRDVLRLDIITGTPHHSVYGNWIASGTGGYTLPVAGARELNFGSTTVRRIGITGTNAKTTSFGGNQICSLDGIPGGAWTVQCAGKTTPFAASGSPLAPTNCNSLGPSGPAEAGPAVGDKNRK